MHERLRDPLARPIQSPAALLKKASIGVYLAAVPADDSGAGEDRAQAAHTLWPHK